MKYRQTHTERVFVLRLEDGDVIHEALERFAADHGIKAAAVSIIGGAGAGSVLVVGPERGDRLPPVPMEHVLHEVHEITGNGTIFPGPDGAPSLHMHIACGRGGTTITGCVREGVRVWHVAEAVITELSGINAARLKDKALGFNLLDLG